MGETAIEEGALENSYSFWWIFSLVKSHLFWCRKSLHGSKLRGKRLVPPDGIAVGLK